MIEFWVYILRCADDAYYTGHTGNLELRLAEHRAGSGSDWTKRRQSVELVWSQYLPSREEALVAEIQIKPCSRAKEETLTASDWGVAVLFCTYPLRAPLDFGRAERIGSGR
jgi:predicted GIY-YIG superfamily endonuclease